MNLTIFFCKHSLQEKKSKEDNYLEDAVSGGKDEDDFGSDGEENGAAESVDDANAMGEFWVFSPTLLVRSNACPLTSMCFAFIPRLPPIFPQLLLLRLLRNSSLRIPMHPPQPLPRKLSTSRWQVV